MKQVNFVELNVEIEIDKYESLDFRHKIGNAIHQQAINVPMSELARKIYYSEDLVNICDEDYAMMLTIISQSFALIIAEAVKRSTIEIKEVEGTDDKAE
ncbi:MAG: hypothetical protein LUH63_07175 [Parabacteroides sp.]|nr:hypothetical protein [Parabacteroides sp.]